MQQWWQHRLSGHHSERSGDHRSSYQRDKARILHSAAFRRLQAKTQVLGVGMSDFYRTRLTHSLEASQIGQGIAAQLRSKYPDIAEQLALDDNLIEALCLAHDIGHPPFGHGGEIALNYKMHQHGGFEGNGQTFRIITRLEPYTPENGMNLCRRTVLGLVKYPGMLDELANYSDAAYQQQDPRILKASLWIPPKGLYQVDSPMLDWVLEGLSESDRSLFCQFDQHPHKHHKTRFKSFDASIMELADDIAYAIHDLEDAIVMNIVHRGDFQRQVAAPIASLNAPWLSAHIDELTDKLFSSEHHRRKDAIGSLVNIFITAIEISNTHEDFEAPLLAYNARLPSAFHQALAEFKGFVYRRVIQKPEIQRLEYRGQQVVMELFDAFASDPARLLPENTKKRWQVAEEQNQGMRIISDYIAGMTDEFASRLYNNLFLPKSGNLNDSLS